MARKAGVSESQIAALTAGDIDSDIWSNQERVLLAFMDAVMAGPDVSDAVFNDARRRFSDRALVEIVTLPVSSTFTSAIDANCYKLAICSLVLTSKTDLSQGVLLRASAYRHGLSSGLRAF
jgi:hypothetical protein